MGPAGLLLVLVVSGARGGVAPAPSSAPASAQCLASRCFGLFWEARSFEGASAACAAGGGRLMRARSTVAAEAIELLRAGRPGGVWLGLRLPEGRCVEAARGALRGFQWVAGDERTDYEAWAGGGPAEGACGPRCVVVSAALRWEEYPCPAAADGFLCEYSYPGGTCAPLALPPAAAPARYTTPFGARDGDLSAFPPGTAAQVPGLAAALECGERPDGSWGWTSAAPGAWPCRLEGGGCEGQCREDEGGRPFCTCPDGAALGPDGRSCPSPCAALRCEHQCAPHEGRGVCLCLEGYELDADGRSCRDVDDCRAQPGPCQQECLNTAGGFLCRCFKGYTMVDGHCVPPESLCFAADCQHHCEVLNGMARCVCFEGFAPSPANPDRCLPVCNRSECPAQCDPHTGDTCYCPEGYILEENEDGAKVCTDIDECYEGRCDGDCTNRYGGFDCTTREPAVHDSAPQAPDYDGSGDGIFYSTTAPTSHSVPPGGSAGMPAASITSTLLSFLALAAVGY